MGTILVYSTLPGSARKTLFFSMLGLRHWFRAKFFQQHQLFFRYHASSRLIVYAWLNDTKTGRAYDSKNDAYRVCLRMLDSGNPPGDWNSLLVEVRQQPPALAKPLQRHFG